MSLNPNDTRRDKRVCVQRSKVAAALTTTVPVANRQGVVDREHQIALRLLTQ